MISLLSNSRIVSYRIAIYWRDLRHSQLPNQHLDHHFTFNNHKYSRVLSSSKLRQYISSVNIEDCSCWRPRCGLPRLVHVVWSKNVVWSNSVADPGSELFPPRIQFFSIPGPGSASKNLSILTQKIVFKLSEIWSGLFIPDPDCSSRIRIPDPDFYLYRILGSKRHWIPDPDPQHCFPVNAEPK